MCFKENNILEEIWKDIDGYEGSYMVSNIGNVKALSRWSLQNHWLPERILKQFKNSSGYYYVDLSKDGIRKHCLVHRLVAKVFVSNPNGYNEVDHIDTNKENNNASNLRWCTHSQNHLNPLTVELKREKNLGKHLSDEQKARLSKRIAVYKDNKLIHIFNSYKDLDLNSKEIVGKQLWNVYAREVIKGNREEYNGYTFFLA